MRIIDFMTWYYLGVLLLNLGQIYSVRDLFVMVPDVEMAR